LRRPEPTATTPSPRASHCGDQIRALEALKADEARLRAQAKRATAEFPATPDLPDLVDALQDAASEAGADLASVGPSAPKTSTVAPELAEITTTVNVKGGYFQIEDFLARLENLIKAGDPGRIPPRSMLVQSLTITSGSGEGATGDSAAAAPESSASPDELQANIALVAFQLASASSSPAPTAGTGTPTNTQVR
jgi:Pilus assembly protein, PilO